MYQLIVYVVSYCMFEMLKQKKKMLNLNNDINTYHRSFYLPKVCHIENGSIKIIQTKKKNWYHIIQYLLCKPTYPPLLHRNFLIMTSKLHKAASAKVFLLNKGYFLHQQHLVKCTKDELSEVIVKLFLSLKIITQKLYILKPAIVINQLYMTILSQTLLFQKFRFCRSVAL